MEMYPIDNLDIDDNRYEFCFSLVLDVDPSTRMFE